LWFYAHPCLEAVLPRRMRAWSAAEHAAFERRMGLDHRRWASYLKQECEAVGIPFERARKASWPVYPLDELEDLPGFRKA